MEPVSSMKVDPNLGASFSAVKEKGTFTTTTTISEASRAMRNRSFTRQLEGSGVEGSHVVNRQRSDSVASTSQLEQAKLATVEGGRNRSGTVVNGKGEGEGKPRMSRFNRRFSLAFIPRKVNPASSAAVKGGVDEITAEKKGDKISDAVLMKQGEKLIKELYKNLKRMEVTDIGDKTGFAETTTKLIRSRLGIADGNMMSKDYEKMENLLGRIGGANDLNTFLINVEGLRMLSGLKNNELSDLKTKFKKEAVTLRHDLYANAPGDAVKADKILQKITARMEQIIDEHKT
jgi:hypothetical protein